MKKLIYYLLVAVLILSGVSVLFYPAISTAWNKYREKRLINAYEESIRQIGQEDFEKYWEDARAYNDGQVENVIPDAFAAGENAVDEVYEGLLNYGNDGIMGYVEIPKIEVKLPIFHGTGDTALQRGAGHLEGSSLPVGGEGTHAILAAHRGLPSAMLFTDLNLLQEGDLFYIYVLDKVLAYEVDQILVVKPDETEALNIVPGEDYVTLLTCTPYGVNTHRLLVRGRRIQYSEEIHEEEKAQVRSTVSTNYLLIGCLGFLAVIAATLLLTLVSGKKKKRKKRKKRKRRRKRT